MTDESETSHLDRCAAESYPVDGAVTMYTRVPVAGVQRLLMYSPGPSCSVGLSANAT